MMKYSLMVFPSSECRSSKRISFWALSARMTNPSSSTSRGEFCGNEWEHTRTEEKETPAGSETNAAYLTQRSVLSNCVTERFSLYAHSELSIRVNKYRPEILHSVWCESVSNYNCWTLNTFSPAARMKQHAEATRALSLWLKSFNQAGMSESGSKRQDETKIQPTWEQLFFKSVCLLGWYFITRGFSKQDLNRSAWHNKCNWSHWYLFNRITVERKSN